MRVIILPDLHGRLDLLNAAVEHFPDAYFVALGDAIDRGANSLGVVRKLLSLRLDGRATLLMGNHERMAIEGYQWYCHYKDKGDPAYYERAMKSFSWWLQAGGESVRKEWQRETGQPLTLEDFPTFLVDYIDSLDTVAYISATHISNQLLPDPCVLVSHAAPPVEHPNYSSPEEAALWLRPSEGPFQLPPNVTYSVHGHTRTPVMTRIGRHIYIDLAAYQTGILGLLEVGDPSCLPCAHLITSPWGNTFVSRRTFGIPIQIKTTVLRLSSQSQ